MYPKSSVIRPKAYGVILARDWPVEEVHVPSSVLSDNIPSSQACIRYIPVIAVQLSSIFLIDRSALLHMTTVVLLDTANATH
jgi:hypothetical protein